MTTRIQRSRAAAQADWPWPESAVFALGCARGVVARHSPAIVATKVQRAADSGLWYSAGTRHVIRQARVYTHI